MIWAGCVEAQWIAEGIDPQTSAGRIEIVDSADGWSREMHVGETVFFADGIYRFVSVERKFGALYLIALGTGGSACAAEYVWLRTDGGSPRLSAFFGTCAEFTDVSITSETVTVTMPAPQAADGYIDFVYDGQVIEERVAGQQSTGIGKRAEDWVGHYPFDLFSDADWRVRLVALMGEDSYRDAGNVIQVSSPMERDGPWVVGRGCRPRMCGEAYGAVALHDDGRIVIAFRSGDGPVQVYGDMSGAVPGVIRDVIHGNG
ncbi:MAG: hypothetical protein AAGL89_06685 [Pseudomonadota bacterium]